MAEEKTEVYFEGQFQGCGYRIIVEEVPGQLSNFWIEKQNGKAWDRIPGEPHHYLSDALERLAKRFRTGE